MNSPNRTRHLLLILLLVLTAGGGASAQQGLRETFGPGVDDGLGGIALGSEMQRLTLDQSAFPLARCNDNSPAILYFRPASRAADRDKWVINLQGGGACSNGLDCSQRWFSVGQAFGRNNMTSVGFPVAADQNGIFERDEEPYASANPFAGYNQVFVHYCSSDSWAGTVADAVVFGLDYRPVLDDTPGGVPVPRTYTISFLGRRIFDAVIQTLRRDGVPSPAYRRADGSAQPLPDLDDARFVILSGGSGGGAGVIHNLDHLRGMLGERTRLVGLTDSIFRPGKDVMDLSQSALCVRRGACTVDEQNQYLFNEGSYANWGAAQGSDQSCLLYHFADPHQCADNRHLVTDHLTTPFFVRMDLYDHGGVEDYRADNLFMLGAPDPKPATPEHEPLSPEEFAAALRADILELADVPRTAHERALIDFTPGAYAPACGDHDMLRSNKGVYLTAIGRRKKEARVLDLFEAWLRHDHRPAIVAAAADRSDSTCPQ
ncbi:MAG TPA: pectin acetylesterase-family hydrolase [Pyrinomonadaceae bacterium]|nr:pectin acetylesterase-family hydrolase [Pyrinomonadaceae bacterium]